MTNDKHKLMVNVKRTEQRGLTTAEVAMYDIGRDGSYADCLRDKCKEELTRLGISNIESKSRTPGEYTATVTLEDETREARMDEYIAWYQIQSSKRCATIFSCEQCPLKYKGCLNSDALERARELLKGKTLELVLTED